MTISRIDQVEGGLDKLLVQFKEKPYVEGMLASYLQETQATQETYEQMLDLRSIDTAEGVQLDLIGRIVGEFSEAKNDDDYRLAIKIRIAINSSNGNIVDITSITKQITGADKVLVIDHYPASVYVYVWGGEDVDIMYPVLNRILPAGVSLGFIGEGKGDLDLTPYSQDLSFEPFVTNELVQIVTNTGEEIYVNMEVLDLLKREAAYLEEVYEQNVIFNLSTDGDGYQEQSATFPSITLTGDFEIGFNIKVINYTPSATAVGHTSVSDGIFLIGTGNKDIILFRNSAGDTSILDCPHGDTQTHNVVVRRESGIVRVYFNGAQKGEFSNTAPFNTDWVGSHSGGEASRLSGTLRNLYIKDATGQMVRRYEMRDGWINNPVMENTAPFGGAADGTYLNLQPQSWFTIGQESTGVGICQEIIQERN